MPRTKKAKEHCDKKENLEHLLTDSHEVLFQSGLCRYPECPMTVLKSVDDRTKSIESTTNQNNKILVAHTEILNKMAEAQTQHMSKISEHTGNIADHLKKYGDENEKLVGIIAGKKQVPISLLFWCVGLVSLAFLVALVYVTKMELLIDKDTLQLHKSGPTVEAPK